MFRELHIYDFDGTLFRSPEPPTDWSGKRDWWGSPESLDEPYVPVKPNASWWIGSTVSEARRSISQQDVFAILATGRSDRSFARYRVPELLMGAGIQFDRVHLAPSTGAAKQFKASLLSQYLLRFPTVEVVRAWEDTKPNLDAMSQVCKRFGVVFDPILVRSTPRQVEVVASRWLARQSG